MTSRQTAIYDGFKSLMPTLAAFYKDGINIIESPYEAKSNLLGHLLREIDSGLRDIFKIDNTRDNSPEKNGHKKSIQSCFGLSDESAFLEKYLKIAKQFNIIAHRSSSDVARPKDPADAIVLWQSFEDVLYPLLGSFMGNTLRLDVLLEREEPNAVADSCLSYILENESKRVYFFQRLNKIGWLRPLYEHGVFEGNLNPEPVESIDKPGYYNIPYWYELYYVTQIAPKIADSQDDEWQIITKIIDGIISYRKEDGTPIRNFRTNNLIIMLISYLPDRYLQDRHISAVRDLIIDTGTFALLSFQDNLVPRLIQSEDKEHLLPCLDIMFSFRDNGDYYPKYLPLFDPYMLGPDIKRWNSDICRICGIEGFKVLQGKFEQVKHDPEFSFFSSVEENDPQNRYQDKYSPKLVFAIIDYALELSVAELSEVTHELLMSDSPIAKRIAFHLIDKRYDQLKDLYWTYPSNPMNEILAYPELYRLLHNHAGAFSEAELIRTLDCVDTFVVPDGMEITPAQIAYHKKSLAIALERLEHSDVKAYLDKINAVCPDKVEHPGYDFYTSVDCSHSVEMVSEDLSSKEIAEIIGLYHKTQPTELPFGLTTYNLDMDFSAAVQQDIVKFTENIDELIEAPASMLRAWIWGLLHYLDKVRVLARAGNVFSVIARVLQKSEFWERANAGPKYSNLEYSFLNDLLVLIRKVGVDKATIPILEQLMDILYLINRNKSNGLDKDWDMRVESLYNNFDYRLYDAMIGVNCQYAKKKGLAEGSRWNSALKEYIDKNISSGDTNPGIFFSIGDQYHSLGYLDKMWMEKNVDTIFFCANRQNQIAAIYGFMMNHALADKTIFVRLLEKGLIEDILLHSEEYDFIVVQHIIINLLEGVRVQTLDDNVLDLLIHTDNKKIYIEIINYVSDLEKNESNALFTKNLWRRFNEADVRNKTEAMQYFYRHSYRLLRQLETLDDDVTSWAVSSAQNSCNETFYTFTEILCPFFSKEPCKAGIILLELTKNANNIYHPRLSELVESIYKAGAQELANEICDTCAAQENFSLSEVYKQHQF